MLLGEVPEDLSIPMLLVGNTVGKETCCELDVIVELKVGGKLNLFAIFPIGTTMQDGSKRKRSVLDGDDDRHHNKLCNITLALSSNTK